MHRIDTPTAVEGKFGAGKNGFTNGDSSTGRLATQLDAEQFNAYQEEICGVIEGAGITLTKGQNTQLLKALKELFLTSNAEQAKTALGLDKVGNWPAVQQGGGTGMEGNKVCAGWNGEKALLQIDDTPMGALFYEKNPPSTQDIFAQAQAIGDGADLSTLTAPGLYYRQYSVQAQTGKNYPVPLAGALTVLKHAGITQVYRVYRDSRCFVRSCYEGTWSDWAQGYDTQNPPSAGDTGAYTKEESHARFLALTGGTVSGAVRFEKGLAVEADITGGPWGEGGLWEAARQAVRQSATFSSGASGDGAGHLNPWWWHQDHRTGLLTQGGLVTRTGDRTRVLFPKGFSRCCRGVQLTLTGSALGAEGFRRASIYATEADLKGFTYCARQLETEAYWQETEAYWQATGE